MIQYLQLETKYHSFKPQTLLKAGDEICGYASIFGIIDQNGDCVIKGAYKAGLAFLKASNRSVKMLWQHNLNKPIGVWQQVIEDDKGLFVRGRILKDVQAGAEALILIRAGAVDGLSIGYRTKRAEKLANGGRKLTELELWEISLVTFPMLPEARINIMADRKLATELLSLITDARQKLLA